MIGVLVTILAMAFKIDRPSIGDVAPAMAMIAMVSLWIQDRVSV